MKKNIRKIVVLLVMASLTLSLYACGGKNVNKDVSLDTVVEAIKTAYGDDYLPSMVVEEDTIPDIYGITSDMYEEIYIEVPMISAHIDTLAAVKCADGKQQAVADALNSYRDYLVNDSLQYPMNQLKLQASRVIEKEGFVFFVALGVIPMDVEEQGEEAAIKKAGELNDIAENVINEYLK